MEEEVLFTGDESNIHLREEEIEFDKYIITVILDSNNQFWGISKVQINKNFINYKTKLKGVHEIEKFYEEL